MILAMNMSMTGVSGASLRALRLRVGFSQAEFARQMGVTRQRVSTVEAFARVPDNAARRYFAVLERILAETPGT